MAYRFFQQLDLSKSVISLDWPGIGASAITPVLSDLNSDGQLDFVFHLSQNQTEANWGTVSTALTPNQLVALVSQPDGTYIEQSKAVFVGVASLSLPGMSRKVVVGDLNGDGISDWAYALNREDGRLGSPTVNSTSEAAAILSNSTGSYSIVELGGINWYHSIYLDELLTKDPLLILAGYYSGPGFGGYAEGYYVGGGYGYTWSLEMGDFKTGEALPAHANTFVTVKASSESPAILTVINASTGEQQLGLFNKADSNWILKDSITPYQSEMVNFVSYSMDRGTAELFLIEPGVYGTAAGYSESKTIQLFPGDTATAVFKFSAAQISTPRSDGYYYQNDGLSIQKLDFFRANGTTLEKLPITIINEYKEINSNFIDVLDFNADELNDVVVYPYALGGQPLVYLNTGGDVFFKIDQSIFPTAPDEWGISASSKFTDLNSDGVLDLFYAPMNGFSLTDNQQLIWETYLGDSTYDASVISTALNISNRLASTLIHTWAGDDHIQDTGAAAASTVIDAGAGIDTVIYSSKSDEYQLTSTESLLHVIGGSNVSINDSLKGVERLQFADRLMALDLDANAGLVAKTLGAVFGKSAVANKEYAGIGLHYVDELDYSYADLMQLAINARLGANPTHTQVVDLLYNNVVGTAPDAATRKSFTDLLDNGTFTVGSLGVLAADTDLNKTNINLTGLAQSGLEYLPFTG